VEAANFRLAAKQLGMSHQAVLNRYLELRREGVEIPYHFLPPALFVKHWKKAATKESLMVALFLDERLLDLHVQSAEMMGYALPKFQKMALAERKKLNALLAKLEPRRFRVTN
jgi:hypothetical protein